MDINPSWKQLAQIPESTTKARVLGALGVVPPPEGVSSKFEVGPDESITKTDQGFVHFSPHRSLYADPDELRVNIKLPKGTPSGDAFRSWLRAQGWVPKSERGICAPQEDTRTII
jgi:hypothetical protein